MRVTPWAYLCVCVYIIRKSEWEDGEYVCVCVCVCMYICVCVCVYDVPEVGKHVSSQHAKGDDVPEDTAKDDDDDELQVVDLWVWVCGCVYV